MRGEAESVFALKGTNADLARTSFGDNRSEEFLLQVHAGIAEGRKDNQVENMAGDDSARSPVISRT